MRLISKREVDVGLQPRLQTFSGFNSLQFNPKTSACALCKELVHDADLSAQTRFIWLYRKLQNCLEAVHFFFFFFLVLFLFRALKGLKILNHPSPVVFVFSAVSVNYFSPVRIWMVLLNVVL